VTKLLPIRMLFVSDRPEETTHIKQTLEDAKVPFTFAAVRGEADVLPTLRTTPSDVIVAVHRPPTIDAIHLIAQLRSTGPKLPVIVVGDLDTPTAIACMRAGASDCVLFSDLGQLASAANGIGGRPSDALDRFEVLFHEALDVILVVEAEAGIIIDVNQSVETVLGYHPRDLYGQHFSILFPDMDNASREEILAELRAYDTTLLSQQFRRKDGTLTSMDLTATLIRWGTGKAILATLRDVSARNEAEAAQREAEDLFRALQRERAMRELKSRFAYMITHEVRNPLAVIKIAAATLRDYEKVLDDTKRHEKFETIFREIDRIDNLVEEVLEFGVGENEIAHFHPQQVDLALFCREIFDEVHSTIGSKHMMIFGAHPPTLRASVDVKLMRRVLLNLLSNAVKYSPVGNVIEMRVTGLAQHVMIEVEDNGIGILEADKDRIFQTFQRGRNVGRVHGTGIGLAITRQAVELHEGTISFTSKEGQGTIFTIMLPRIDE